MTNNITLMSDSYKSGSHWKMHQPNVTDAVYYAEMREGGTYEETVFFGLQAILMKYLTGKVVTHQEIAEAKQIIEANTGPGSFNEEGWARILNEFDGHLPLVIRALPEGSVVKEGTVLFTIQPTHPDFVWLVGHVEPVLLKAWYPSTVATIGRDVRKEIETRYLKTKGNTDMAEYAYHDFGYRSVSSEDSAAIGGLAHLVYSKGTDTVPALMEGALFYDADLTSLGHSVPASEHSVMTALGREGESTIVGQLIEKFPTGVLSVVADSYDIYNFVEHIVGEDHREAILNRTGGPFVVRPDSPTDRHRTPAAQMVWIYNTLYEIFGGETNSLGYTELNPVVNVLWGDGIDRSGISKIYDAVTAAGFVPGFVIGQGGQRLQAPQRDDQRWALKCSAQKCDGVWYNIQKQPLDRTKWSKAGTFAELDLPTVFYDGFMMTHSTFDQVRERASVDLPSRKESQ